jgi:hypothetical protein
MLPRAGCGARRHALVMQCGYSSYMNSGRVGPLLAIPYNVYGPSLNSASSAADCSAWPTASRSAASCAPIDVSRGGRRRECGGAAEGILVEFALVVADGGLPGPASSLARWPPHRCSSRRANPHQARGSDHAAVGVDGLAVDPAGRAGQEEDDLRDVGGRAELLQWVHPGHPVDGLLVLAVEEQRRRRKTGCHCDDGDVAAAQLLRQYQADGIDRAFGRRVARVGRQREFFTEVEKLPRLTADS